MVVRVKWLGHASFKIEASGKTIYIDLEEHSQISDKATLILVTHSHFDHCDPSKVAEARKEDTIVIAPPSCTPKIKGTVKTLKPGEEAVIDNIRVKAVEAYNTKRFRSPGNPFHPRGSGVGYLLTAEGKTIYHAGDTDYISEMEQLGPIDLALIPSGNTYTMDNTDAAEAALAINPKVAVPMHRWSTNPEEFKHKVEANSKIKVVCLEEGEVYQID